MQIFLTMDGRVFRVLDDQKTVERYRFPDAGLPEAWFPVDLPLVTWITDEIGSLSPRSGAPCFFRRIEEAELAQMQTVEDRLRYSRALLRAVLDLAKNYSRAYSHQILTHHVMLKGYGHRVGLRVGFVQTPIILSNPRAETRDRSSTGLDGIRFDIDPEVYEHRQNLPFATQLWIGSDDQVSLTFRNHLNREERADLVRLNDARTDEEDNLYQYVISESGYILRCVKNLREPHKAVFESLEQDGQFKRLDIAQYGKFSREGRMVLEWVFNKGQKLASFSIDPENFRMILDIPQVGAEKACNAEFEDGWDLLRAQILRMNPNPMIAAKRSAQTPAATVLPQRAPTNQSSKRTMNPKPAPVAVEAVPPVLVAMRTPAPVAAEVVPPATVPARTPAPAAAEVVPPVLDSARTPAPAAAEAIPPALDPARIPAHAAAEVVPPVLDPVRAPALAPEIYSQALNQILEQRRTALRTFAENSAKKFDHWYFFNGKEKARRIRAAIQDLNQLKLTSESTAASMADQSGLRAAVHFQRHTFLRHSPARQTKTERELELALFQTRI